MNLLANHELSYFRNKERQSGKIKVFSGKVQVTAKSPNTSALFDSHSTCLLIGPRPQYRHRWIFDSEEKRRKQ
jgi:hypothetical protein